MLISVRSTEGILEACSSTTTILVQLIKLY